MRVGVDSCDLGLSGGRFGSCRLDTKAEPPDGSELSIPQRVARAAAGLAFVGFAAPLLGRRALRPAGAIAAWFGVSHLVAAGTAFDGCPELGAIPSLLLRRKVATECGPWDFLDRRLGLKVDPARDAGV